MKYARLAMLFVVLTFTGSVASVEGGYKVYCGGEPDQMSSMFTLATCYGAWKLLLWILD